MVVIRLARFGSKKRPYYHMVVTDSENPRDGRYLEQVGTYHPGKPVDAAKILIDRVDHWVGLGAQLSTRVRHVVNDARRATPAA